jgi:3-phenylpropionate/cinnamic acid dioxygenase small subunit
MTGNFADVSAGVTAVLAEYVHALDDGRTDDVVATFREDGVMEIEGMGTFSGTDELSSAYAGWVPRGPQRHMVLNAHVTDLGDGRARSVSDVVLLVRGADGWGVTMVGRYDDELVEEGGTWRFLRRSATFVN